jgi:hypothetical protein
VLGYIALSFGIRSAMRALEPFGEGIGFKVLAGIHNAVLSLGSLAMVCVCVFAISTTGPAAQLDLLFLHLFFV